MHKSMKSSTLAFAMVAFMRLTPHASAPSVSWQPCIVPGCVCSCRPVEADAESRLPSRDMPVTR